MWGTRFVACAIVLTGMTASEAKSASQYVQIGPGPSLEYAKARCDNASMGVGQGYFAYGSQSYVAGVALGNALGNILMQNRYYNNCMTMSGWKKMKVAPGKSKATVNTNFKKQTSTLSRKCREAQTMKELMSGC